MKTPLCGEKRYWPHEHAANAAARLLGQSAYKCPDCNGWHLTKQPESVRRLYEDRERQRSQEALQMGKSSTTITFRVLQANPAGAAEITKTDKEGAVTGIDRQIYEDVRLGVTGVETGSQDGGGRLVSGELVLSVPEGDLKVGQVLEAKLTEKDDDDDDRPTPGGLGENTLRQSPDEAERGRKPDGTLGGKGKSGGKSRKRSGSSRRSGPATSPQETDERAGSPGNPPA